MIPRSLPICLLFIALKLGEDGLKKQNKTSRLYSGTVMYRLLPMTPLLFGLEQLATAPVEVIDSLPVTYSYSAA